MTLYLIVHAFYLCLFISCILFYAFLNYLSFYCFHFIWLISSLFFLFNALFICLFIFFNYFILFLFMLCQRNKIWQEEEDQELTSNFCYPHQHNSSKNVWILMNVRTRICIYCSVWSENRFFFPLHICLCLKFVCLFTIRRDQCDQTGPWTAGGTSAEEGHARCGRHEAAGRRSSWTLPAPSIFQNPRQCTPEK